MTGNSGYMQRYAMLFGAYMSILWICKFIFFFLPALQGPNDVLFLLFILATLFVPFLGYYYAKRYRDLACEGVISFASAWLFTAFMYVCAALLTSIVHYVYFRYFDQGYVIGQLRAIIDAIPTEEVPLAASYMETMDNNIDMLETLTPFDIMITMLVQNIYYGVWLSLFTALFVMRREKRLR